MLNRFFGLLSLITILFISSCTVNNIKYPEYIFHTKKHPDIQNHIVRQKVKGYDASKGIDYLKDKECSKAIDYFRNLPNNLHRTFCIALSYGYCSKFSKSLSLLKKIEPKIKDNILRSRVYSLMGLMDFLSKKKLFRDYATIAYAYDPNNKLAHKLMFQKPKKTTENSMDDYFYIAFEWCEEIDETN